MQKKTLFFSLVGVLAASILAAPMVSADQTEDLKKKYAPILGDYEFDLSDMGMGVVTMQVYLEGDELYMWPDTSDNPVVIEPVEGKEFEFNYDDPDEGLYIIKFLKDESGEYNKCHVVNETMGMDTTGTKIKG